MARQLKVFSLGIHGFINREVGDALGLPAHVRQARVLVAAATKADAVQVLAEHGFPNHPLRDPEFRVSMGDDTDALTAAGVIAAPGVWVTTLMSRPGDPVVAMLPGGAPQRIGRLDGGYGKPDVFVAEGK